MSVNAISSAALDEAAARLAGAQRLLIGTAAGMSAESGIPTYRRSGETSWKNYGAFEALGIKAEDLSCPQAFEDEPELAWGFLEWKRRLVAEAEPHEGYAALHAIARAAPESFIQTTNVDGLHLRAGWDPGRLHEIHGSFWRLQCLGPCRREAWEETRVPLADLDPETMRAARWPRCPACGRTARPHAIMFADLDYVGDAPAELARAEFKAAVPDVMLIVGESGVIPTHVFDGRTLKREQGTFLINLNPDASSKGAREADLQLSLGAREGLLALAERIL